jgi:excisionase family DNA binding protein
MTSRSTQKEPPTSVGLLSVERAAIALGVSHSGLRRLVANGDISLVRLGRRVLVDPADIDDLIERRKRRPTTTVAAS